MAEEAVASVRASRLSAMDQRHWILRRLHSLTGLVPIGAFLFFHIFENSYVTHGGDAWWKESEFTRNLPFQVIVEALLLWIPISYHAIYGVVITMTADPNVGELRLRAQPAIHPAAHHRHPRAGVHPVSFFHHSRMVLFERRRNQLRAHARLHDEPGLSSPSTWSAPSLASTISLTEFSPSASPGD